jgi:hypothetical protein
MSWPQRYKLAQFSWPLKSDLPTPNPTRGEVYASANKSPMHSNGSRFLFKGIVLWFAIAVRLSIVGVAAVELRQFCAFCGHKTGLT